MNDAQKRILKVLRFYKSLPDTLLDNIFNNLEFNNRDTRRKFKGIKSTDKKVEFLFSTSTRKELSDVSYQLVKDKVSLNLETSTYDDIIFTINDENKIYYSIFFFRWCYENGADGICNDEKYFNKFVDSKLFDCILEGSPINLDELNSVGESIKETETNEINEQTDFDARCEEAKMKLIGHIEKRTTYFNFFPQYELTNGRLREIPVSELKSEFPTVGGINLAFSTFSSESGKFLENDINSDMDKDLYIKNLYVIEIDKYYLEENYDDRYRVKLELQKLVDDGYKLSDTIQSAENFDIYKVVFSESETIPTNTFNSGNIFLREEAGYVDGEKVLLYYDGKFYGPFRICFRPIDGKYFVKTGASENNFLVPYFSADDVQEVELEKQHYTEDPTYTSFACTLKKESMFDSITDEILLEKISDDISLELAKEKPEEFSHLYSNSPFLAKLPQEIIGNRMLRLQEIISNVERLKDKKYEVFESLLKLYQDSSSEASDKMIKESDTYKELNNRYSEERRKNEDAEKQIRELKKNQDELNSQLGEMNKNSVNVISSDENEKLKADNKNLQEELDKYKSIVDVTVNIEKLKKEQSDLETTNRYLETRNATIKNDIKKAIDTAGSDGMAALAFDPFISSEMMKKAASWDSAEEDKEYKELGSSISSIVPSELYGKELVDYIVKYVQERREYSRNDIINIYISIAQNFITIFSGEPGTGKTSICNIVAETLGLLKYGERINRFVSVSVERGWSSKRDLIGYFNPLTRKYDKSNSKIYDALRMLDVERNESKYPFLIMLDEANLSPIEYYWADFMRLTDRSSDNDMYINIGTEKELFVPETLKFVATINTDQTTETLSPRLIDRACIIKLPKVEPKQIDSNVTLANEIITWKNFYDTFSTTTELNPITQKALKEIYKLFNDYGMSVSPRIQLGIKKYVMAAQEIMEDESDVLAREKALDFAIIQKLLPKINGYYSLYERFFDTLKQLCKEYNLNMTEEAIFKIIDAQERNMGYCQYLI